MPPPTTSPVPIVSSFSLSNSPESAPVSQSSQVLRSSRLSSSISTAPAPSLAPSVESSENILPTATASPGDALGPVPVFGGFSTEEVPGSFVDSELCCFRCPLDYDDLDQTDAYTYQDYLQEYLESLLQSSTESAGSVLTALSFPLLVGILCNF